MTLLTALRRVNQRSLRSSVSRSLSGILLLTVVLSGCDMLKIEEESTTPTSSAAPVQQPPPPPAAPTPPPPPPVVPPEKIAQGIIDDFYKLTPDQINDITLQKLASIYAPAKASIETLNLQSSQITDNCFESIKQFENLKRLNLALTGISKNSMVNLPSLKNLEHVDLGHTPADNEVVKLLAGIPTIKTIDLNETAIDDDALTILDTFPALERLSIAGVGAINGGGFRGAKRLSHLKSLVVNKTGLVDPALKLIAKYPIEELHMSYCFKLSDAGISYLTGMKELRYLNLKDNNTLSSRGLVKVANNPKLEAINLSGISRFDDQGLKAFSRSKSLKFIEVGGTAVTDRGKDALKKVIPDITFGMPH